MIPAGIVNALVAWASGDEGRIAQLVAERDALVAAFLGTGGQATGTMTSLSANGKAFTFMASCTQDEKLSVLTNILIQLGEIDAAVLSPSVTYGNFADIVR